MKRLILAIVLLMTCSCIYAQYDTIVSVCVDGERLDNILTDEEINSVTRLKITGTLTEADYSCLRTMFCKNLVELNLHDADIDTIPAHAFDLYYDGHGMGCNIILPLKLKFLSDYSLCMRDGYFSYILSENIPDWDVMSIIRIWDIPTMIMSL